MNKYESIIIVNPKLNDEEVKRNRNKIYRFNK